MAVATRKRSKAEDDEARAREMPRARTLDPLSLLRRDDDDVGAGEEQRHQRQGLRRRAPRPH